MARIAIIKRAKCHPAQCGNYLCAKVCPVNRTGKDCITPAEDKKAQISETLCIGCGICPKRCPFEAITVINLPEVLKEAPIYRYGLNAFELFRLPAPQASQVVGILGPNGVGKTTALEILAGIKKPNLGKFDNLTDKEIIQRFRGTELQAYLQKSFSKEIKISYKPQHIDLIPEKFEGKVSALLEKLGSKDKVASLCKELGIAEILGRNLNQLAGGELQKVAIAAAMLKPADLYLFDEPASFLDIKERIKIAGIIRKLAETKSVIVVEHDLIILDYLADLVHVFFGEPAVYGVVSSKMAAKVGINSYLEGFLKAENIRFREKAIKFEAGLAEKAVSQASFVKWPALEKKLGAFKLKADASEIKNKEIIGIVGANSIGKTTFARLLAGELEPDKGKPDTKLKISYKPQYVKAQKGIKVLEALTEVNKEVLSAENKINILRPLQLEHLFNKNLDELSGGELQRVAIAVCLLREADFYLLDEPSNYLDVEQRLAAAKAIQRVIKSKEVAGAVIDHDLVFIAFLSDRLLAFSGQPGISGLAKSVQPVKEGMNSFLKELGITCRKDPETGRPRVNKLGSVMDREQREKGRYYL